MGAHQSETVVAKFADFDSASRALGKLREAHNNKEVQIRQGAVVVGTVEGPMPVKDLDDVGLGEVTRNAADLVLYLGIGSTKIAVETALAGAGLLLSSARRVAALSGSILLMPARMALGGMKSSRIAEEVEAVLEPGTCAIVAVVDSPGDAETVRADLLEYGGEVVQYGAD